MSAPAFSRERTIVPRKPAPAASPGPCAALSVESPRLPFFDGSTHKASPPANWFNRAHQSAAAKRRSAGPSASSHRAGSRRVTGRRPVRCRGARASAAAHPSGRRWICTTAAAQRPARRSLGLRSGSVTDARNWYTTSRPPCRLAIPRRSPCFAWGPSPGTRVPAQCGPVHLKQRVSPACAPSRSDPRCAGPLFRAAARYIRSIIALPNPEQLTCVEPGIRRAKS